MTTRSTAPEVVARADPSERASRYLHGRWLVAARLVWLAVCGLALVTLVVALPVFLQASRSLSSPASQVPGQLSLQDVQLLAQWGVSLDVYAAYQTAQIALFALVFVAAGALLFWRKSDDRFALFVALWFLLFGVAGSPLLDPLIRAYPAWQLPVRLLQGACLGCFPIFTYLFPDGRFVPDWTRSLTIAWLVWIVVAPFTPFVVADFAGASTLWFGLLIPIGIGIGLVAQVYRYLRISRRAERQQTKWVLFGVGVVALGVLLYGLLPLVIPSITQAGLARVLYLTFSETLLLILPFFLLLVCIGIAILRYQLWDIDQLIHRTLVYAALSAGVVGIYVLTVGTLGALFQSRENPVIGLVATGLVALVFQPLHARLQRAVNRLIYGERDDPYAVLTHMSQQLQATLNPTAVLPTIAQAIAQTLKLPYVALALNQGDRFAIAAVYGVPVGEPLRLPLVYQGETVGQLLVAPRTPDEAFTATERRLLENIALQAGVAAHAVRLTTDLQRSRERLVTAREEERRRLRRDLHDGLGPQLASLTLTIAAARELLRHDGDAADRLLQELASHTQAAISEIRRVVYELRPPALDDLGLVLALREQAARYSRADLQIVIDAPEQLPPLPAAVEVAAYRIVQEALTNVVRHAGARRCVVRLTLRDTLDLAIADDGIGLPTGTRAGVGLTSMRERSAELGGRCLIETAPRGGTRVCIHLPLLQESV